MRTALALALACLLFLTVATRLGAQMPIQIACEVDQGRANLDDGFGKAFCLELLNFLSEDLGTAFVSAEGGWKHDGAAVALQVYISSPINAKVTSVAGEVRSGVFEPSGSVDSSLGVKDGRLLPSSSRVLVRGIGLQLGLIK